MDSRFFQYFNIITPMRLMIPTKSVISTGRKHTFSRILYEFFFIFLSFFKIILTIKSFYQLILIKSFFHSTYLHMKNTYNENLIFKFNRKIKQGTLSERNIERIALSENITCDSILAQYHHYLGDSKKTGFYNLMVLKNRLELQSDTFGENRITFLDPSWTASIGHLGLLSMFVRFKRISLNHDVNTTVVLNSQSNNNLLLNLYSKHLNIVPFQPDIHNSFKSQFQGLSTIETTIGHLGLYSAFNYAIREDSYKKLFDLPHNVLDIGFDYLKNFGFKNDDWFVTFHIRETRRKDGFISSANPPISSFLPAIKHVLDSGGWVVRVGNHSMTPLPSDIAHANQVIDYSQERNQSEDLNLFFLGACKLMVGSESGPKLIPNIFGVPCLVTNLPHVSHCHDLPGFTIPQNIYTLKEKRTLSLRESLESPLGWNAREYAEGFSRQPNSADEILDSLQYLLLDKVSKTESNLNFEKIRGLENSAKIAPSFIERNPHYLE